MPLLENPASIDARTVTNASRIMCTQGIVSCTAACRMLRQAARKRVSIGTLSIQVQRDDQKVLAQFASLLAKSRRVSKLNLLNCDIVCADPEEGLARAIAQSKSVAKIDMVRCIWRSNHLADFFGTLLGGTKRLDVFIDGCSFELPSRVREPILPPQPSSKGSAGHLLNINSTKMNSPFAHLLFGMIEHNFPVQKLYLRDTISKTRRPLAAAKAVGAALARSKRLKVFHLRDPEAGKDCAAAMLRGLVLTQSVTDIELRDLPKGLQSDVSAMLQWNDSLISLWIQEHNPGPYSGKLSSLAKAVCRAIPMHARLRELHVDFAPVFRRGDSPDARPEVDLDRDWKKGQMHGSVFGAIWLSPNLRRIQVPDIDRMMPKECTCGWLESATIAHACSQSPQMAQAWFDTSTLASQWDNEQALAERDMTMGRPARPFSLELTGRFSDQHQMLKKRTQDAASSGGRCLVKAIVDYSLAGSNRQFEGGASSSCGPIEGQRYSTKAWHRLQPLQDWVRQGADGPEHLAIAMRRALQVVEGVPKWQWWLGKLLAKRGVATPRHARLSRAAWGTPSSHHASSLCAPEDTPGMDAAQFCIDALDRFKREVVAASSVEDLARADLLDVATMDDGAPQEGAVAVLPLAVLIDGMATGLESGCNVSPEEVGSGRNGGAWTGSRWKDGEYPIAAMVCGGAHDALRVLMRECERLDGEGQLFYTSLQGAADPDFREPDSDGDWDEILRGAMASWEDLESDGEGEGAGEGELGALNMGRWGISEDLRDFTWSYEAALTRKMAWERVIKRWRAFQKAEGRARRQWLSLFRASAVHHDSVG